MARRELLPHLALPLCRGDPRLRRDLEHRQRGADPAFGFICAALTCLSTARRDRWGGGGRQPGPGHGSPGAAVPPGLGHSGRGDPGRQLTEVGGPAGTGSSVPKGRTTGGHSTGGDPDGHGAGAADTGSGATALRATALPSRTTKPTPWARTRLRGASHPRRRLGPAPPAGPPDRGENASRLAYLAVWMLIAPTTLTWATRLTFDRSTAGAVPTAASESRKKWGYYWG